MLKKVLVIFLLITAIYIALTHLDCDRHDDNAYVVSSGCEFAPISSVETGLTIGLAYPGFAVALTDVRNNKAYFDITISNSSQTLFIPLEYMESAYVNLHQDAITLSIDIIYVNANANINIADEDKQPSIARFIDSVGPIMPVYIKDDAGYVFVLGMNWVYVLKEDIVLIKSPIDIPG